ncbi:lysophospholipase-like protein 1 isoform X1 [Macrobrachium nipponense]|uniref:lysophospholipase-like protein 1 isoform X1 n=2 Tax=Macrobrachium nipponense TaxID=159736 RepID=UPI0030C80662
MATRIPKLAIVPQTKAKPTASVIFLHGSGGTGVIARQSLKMILGRDFSFPHIRLIYPTAPVRPYTLAGGIHRNVWFDRLGMSLETPDDPSTLEPIAEEISQLIEKEISLGISAKRVIIGGFSMGASLAMQVGYRFRPDIGGVFVFSSFLSKSSEVYKVLDSSSTKKPLPPLLMCHGAVDDIVPYEWGHYTFGELQKRGIPAEFHSFPRLDHSLNVKELNILQAWLLKHLPDV